MTLSSSIHAQRGPCPVGVLHARLPSAQDSERWLPTEIWYPAAPGQQELHDAPHPLGRPHLADPGLEPVASPCPVIVFSHGNSGLRQQSTFLTTHLASWGYAVAAPDHVGNTFPETAALDTEEARRTAHLEIRAHRPHDLRGVLGALFGEPRVVPELPPLDPERIGVLGHSFGGWTALKLPRLEPRVRAVCALAPVSEPFVGRKAFEPDELPLPTGVATLVIAAGEDVLVDLDTSIHPLFARLGQNAVLEVVDRSDHFHFCDGIELLHKMHENRPREGRPRPVLPLHDLLEEEEMHALLCERVTRFFDEALRPDVGVASTGERKGR